MFLSDRRQSILRAQRKTKISLSDVYGVSYGVFEDAVRNHEFIQEDQARFSYLDLDLTKTPLPFNLIVSTYLEQACAYLRLDRKRLVRLYFLSKTSLLKKIFSCMFWLFLMS